MDRTASYLERHPSVISDTPLMTEQKRGKGMLMKTEDHCGTPHVGRADVSAQQNLDMVQVLRVEKNTFCRNRFITS